MKKKKRSLSDVISKGLYSEIIKRKYYFFFRLTAADLAAGAEGNAAAEVEVSDSPSVHLRGLRLDLLRRLNSDIRVPRVRTSAELSPQRGGP